MNRFYHSRTYRFSAQRENLNQYIFDLVNRTCGEATFRLRDKGFQFPIKAQIKVDYSSNIPTETAKFTYKGIDFELRADFFMAKRYNMTPADRRKKHEHKLKDLHLHSYLNASEFESGKECCCIYCQRFFPADEVVEFVDDDETALCPYCGIDSVIVLGADEKISKELLAELNKRYF